MIHVLLFNISEMLQSNNNNTTNNNNNLHHSLSDYTEHFYHINTQKFYIMNIYCKYLQR